MENNFQIERDKIRLNAQLELIKENVQAKHQTTINLAISSIALLALSSLLDFTLGLKIGIGAILIFNLVIFWHDIYVTRGAVSSSLSTITSILGSDFEEKMKKIDSAQKKYLKYPTELSGIIFTIIVIYFLILVIFSHRDIQNGSKDKSLAPMQHQLYNQDLRKYFRHDHKEDSRDRIYLFPYKY